MGFVDSVDTAVPRLISWSKKSTPVKTAPNFRWGIVLQVFGYWLIFLPARKLWTVPVPLWRLVGDCFAAGILPLYGCRHLGKTAGEGGERNADQPLMSGPYRIVRHPIYASMLAMITMSAFLCREASLVADGNRRLPRGLRSVFTWKTACCGNVSVRVLKSGR